MVNGLYLYSSFLVLMTTQSATQYSFVIHPFTHTFIGSTYFYEEPFGVQYLAQGHFVIQTNEQLLYPPATAALLMVTNMLTNE